MPLREGDKRQIESIVRHDKHKSEGNRFADAFYGDDVVSRFPRTFHGVDETEASEYYDQVWTDGTEGR